MRVSDLFEAQIANADTVASYCEMKASEVADPARRAWMAKAARRFISNSEDGEFLIRYEAEDYADETYVRPYIDRMISPEMKPYLERIVAAGTPFAVFIPIEEADDDDSEDAADKLDREMADVRSWLNAMPPEYTAYRNMNFDTALRFAEAHSKKMARTLGPNDAVPILKIGDMTWVQLKTRDAVTAEGHLMQNCLKDQPRYGSNVETGSAQCYSLRDRNGRPHVTVYAWGTFVEQAKGKQNAVPKPIYQKAANLLFRHLGLNVEKWETTEWEHQPSSKISS